jgi:hypothetical protein
MSRAKRAAQHSRKLVLAFLIALLGGTAGRAQSAAPPAAEAPKEAGRITPEQAGQLFGLIDELLKFSSQETGLPIHSGVKHQLTNRAAVESYLKKKFAADEDAKRLQSSEIVLKKMGLLERDFDLQPFLLALLTEQIEAYYDAKTKTVSLLDWVDLEEQKPALAHELTHALQDQHASLDKWGDQTPSKVSRTASEDADHVARDEMDTAREAVVEGQATAVMMDYILKPMDRSLLKDPEVVDALRQQMNGGGDSPVMARAPLLLAQSLLFPYREGLSFTQDLWMDQGQAAAFVGAMDRPPSSSWEILNPREYEHRHAPPVPLLPNIHPLVDKLYKPYDIGQMGQLDVQILTTLFGGEQASSDLTPAWNGGVYWAGQLRSAKTAAEQASTKSLAFFYLSAWKNEASADAFAQVYAGNLGRRYSGLKDLPVPEETGSRAQQDEQAYSTNEGPVLIVTRGKLVFVAESFDLPLARLLAELLLDTQGTGELRTTQAMPPGGFAADRPRQTLSAGLIRFFSNCGVMKAAVHAGVTTPLAAIPPAPTAEWIDFHTEIDPIRAPAK